MSDYSLSQKFHIDDGELDGMSVQKAFVLGVEFQMIYEGISSGMLKERMIHTDNKHRISKMAKGLNAKVDFRWINDDWMEFRFLGYERS